MMYFPQTILLLGRPFDIGEPAASVVAGFGALQPFDLASSWPPDRQLEMFARYELCPDADVPLRTFLDLVRFVSSASGLGISVGVNTYSALGSDISRYADTLSVGSGLTGGTSGPYPVDRLVRPPYDDGEVAWSEGPPPDCYTDPLRPRRSPSVALKRLSGSASFLAVVVARDVPDLMMEGCASLENVVVARLGLRFEDAMRSRLPFENFF